ncbi:peptidoglycan DD-metalloendopeptidase family protein [Accumulibacter sp.]|uniref:peptidoglycan DD-metalloendopeptidase family protein n=1 Tax=Accumulibacter sp. TaxID=2053492 RepID=UPI0025FB8E29|nr:peptidoglycan DD-metalloendopeptidase family protein [Accumulibacter sp.]MCM8610823.1 peptidoglycan DD-metalloendopeptidase family protein [Accumulibacter sp.]MCM8636357.1 peptidoglycan DD-metalloendopeptidase family protein [Accumulibacter sp.]MCM8640064.1 peptidoglycan DD-metalloendopeptidase family protein [Accumulibacter sp.]
MPVPVLPIRLLAGLLAVPFVLAGCAGKGSAPAEEAARVPARQAVPATTGSRDGYVVKRGDTLYSIALDHGLDYRELAGWNGIDNPNRILVGQVLRVRPPGAAPAAEGVVVRPIAAGAAVEQRPLTASPSPAGEQRSPAATADLFKRAPLAGKEPYSEQALARAQAQAAEPAVAVAPVVARAEARPEARPEVKTEMKPEAKAEAKAEARPEAKADNEARSGDASGNEDVSWMWPANGKLVATFSEGGNKGIDIAGKAGDSVVAAGSGKVVYSGTGLRGYGKLVIVKHNNTFLTAYAHNQNVLVKEGQSVGKGQKIAEMGNTDADQVKLHFEIRRQGKPVDPLKLLPGR